MLWYVYGCVDKGEWMWMYDFLIPYENSVIYEIYQICFPSSL